MSRWEVKRGKKGEVLLLMCVNARSGAKYSHSAVFSARTLIRSTARRFSFKEASCLLFH